MPWSPRGDVYRRDICSRGQADDEFEDNVEDSRISGITYRLNVRKQYFTYKFFIGVKVCITWFMNVFGEPEYCIISCDFQLCLLSFSTEKWFCQSRRPYDCKVKQLLLR